MIMQIVRFETSMSEEEVLSTAGKRKDAFLALPGLLQKYYIKLKEPNHYGGVYLWASKEAMESYRKSDLASSIPAAYKVVGKPALETVEVLFSLKT